MNRLPGKVLRAVKRFAARSISAAPPAKERAASSPAPPGFQIDVGPYTHYEGRMPSLDGSTPGRPLPLYAPDELDTAVAELRRMLEQDGAPECQAALRGDVAGGIRSFAGHWFQRIDYPRHGISSTSDPALAYIDEGGFNTLARRLSGREASILRPYPKWFYIQPLLPELAGKSVLEVGSSNGFFSFRFAELGARAVTGVEIVRRQHESAVWSAGVLAAANVRFLHTDFLLDQTLEPHDVVFLSEVHNHFLFPLLGLVKLVNLARETLLVDTVTMDTPEHGLRLDSGWNNRTGHLIYHSFHLTHGLLLDFLNLIGVPPGRVTRYQAPDEPHHSLYRIDTRGVETARARLYYSEYLDDVLGLRFRT